MCSHVFDYNWSSDKDYRSSSSNYMTDIDFILNIFSEDRTRAIDLYIDFMDENKRESIDVFEGREIIGDFSLLDLENCNIEKRKSLDSILKEITESEEDYHLIRQGSRKRYLSKYKKEFIDKALKENYKLRDIGSYI